MPNRYGRFTRGFRRGENLWGQNRLYSPQLQLQRRWEWYRQFRLQRFYNILDQGLARIEQRRNVFHRLKQRVAAELEDLPSESDTPYDTTNSDTGTTVPPASTVPPSRPHVSIRNTELVDIEGIGPRFAEKLHEAGISNVDELLESTKNSRARKRLEEETGIPAEKILDWVAMGRLLPIKGLGPEWAEVLHAAGVDSPEELAQRNPKNLYQKVVEVNKEKKLARKLFTPDQLEDFMDQVRAASS